jgi:HPt (histidine-containing phosphotransfer) domain-containing protein
MAASVNEKSRTDPGEDTISPLRAVLEPKAFREIVELYESTVRNTANAIGEAAERSDLDSIGRNAHDLAGLCGQLGCGRASEIARRIEGACMDGNSGVALRLVPELTPAVADVLLALEDMAR